MFHDSTKAHHLAEARVVMSKKELLAKDDKEAGKAHSGHETGNM